MVQRYKFESKSQPEHALGRGEHCCFQWFKGTNLKANHNGSSRSAIFSAVVSNGSKVQIWKQITTGSVSFSDCCLLFPMVQRYKFESKSQLLNYVLLRVFCCFQWFKGTNLKANHNEIIKKSYNAVVVSNGSKVQIWKQITTPPYRYADPACCFQWFKGTNLKANHNS